MDELTDNQQKYENYRVQSRRLASALRSGFYLEAVFIDYAIIEDRLESALTHAGAFNSNRQRTITSKLTKLEKLCDEERGLAHRYFSAELLAAIRAWKDRRNPLVHKLLKQHATTSDFEAVAREGEALVKTLKSRVGSFNRALDRERVKREDGR